MTRKKPFHHGRLRQALVDSAIELLDREGASGVTIRAVAAKVGVSHAAPANHFKDRRALLTAVAHHEFLRLEVEIEHQLTPALAREKRLDFFCGTVADYAYRYPNRYDLVWRADLVNHVDPELRCCMNRIYGRLCDEIQAGPTIGNFDLDTFAIAFWSMTHGYICLRLSGMFQDVDDPVRGQPRFKALMALLLTLTRPGNP